jgi:hypothetical protein
MYFHSHLQFVSKSCQLLESLSSYITSLNYHCAEIVFLFGNTLFDPKEVYVCSLLSAVAHLICTRYFMAFICQSVRLNINNNVSDESSPHISVANLSRLMIRQLLQAQLNLPSALRIFYSTLTAAAGIL